MDLTATPLMCDDCGGRMCPLDVVLGWVEVDDAGIVTAGDGVPVDLRYTPTGHTVLDWDSATTIGHGCPDCGRTHIDTDTVLGAIAARP